eukprot:7420554-Pyramimonas_sp.AAC.1
MEFMPSISCVSMGHARLSINVAAYKSAGHVPVALAVSNCGRKCAAHLALMSPKCHCKQHARWSSLSTSSVASLRRIGQS